MRLSVIIPNYNGEQLLPPLLDAVVGALAAARYSWETVVSDDASTDGSCSLISAQYPQVKLVRAIRNVGFGENCNLGASVASGEFLAFVNNDIRFGCDVFSPLIEQLSVRPGVFAVMPLIYALPLRRVENLQELWLSKGLPWLRPVSGMPVGDVALATEALQGKPLSVPLCGAFFCCRRKHFGELGGFASVFGRAYWEDVDLGCRARRLGLDTVVVPGITVEHLHSQTMDEALGVEGKRARLLRNQALFLARNLDLLKPVPGYRLHLLLRVFQRLAGRDWRLAPLYLRLALGRVSRPSCATISAYPEEVQSQ